MTISTDDPGSELTASPEYDRRVGYDAEGNKVEWQTHPLR
jgi:hypothetical protein